MLHGDSLALAKLLMNVDPDRLHTATQRLRDHMKSCITLLFRKCDKLADFVSVFQEHLKTRPCRTVSAV